MIGRLLSWYATPSKLLSGLAGPMLVGWLVTAGLLLISECARRDLRKWQDETAQATRDAADHPKLATGAVPQQIRNLGNAIDRTRLAMAQAKASALANKMAVDAGNENRRKDADDALVPTLETALRGADAYARTGRLQCAPAAATVDRGDNRRSYLPRAADAAEVSDRSGAGSSLVLIPRSALDTCTALKVRLDNAHDWAVGGKP